MFSLAKKIFFFLYTVGNACSSEALSRQSSQRTLSHSCYTSVFVSLARLRRVKHVHWLRFFFFFYIINSFRFVVSVYNVKQCVCRQNLKYLKYARIIRGFLLRVLAPSISVFAVWTWIAVAVRPHRTWPPRPPPFHPGRAVDSRFAIVCRARQMSPFVAFPTLTSRWSPAGDVVTRVLVCPVTVLFFFCFFI